MKQFLIRLGFFSWILVTIWACGDEVATTEVNSLPKLETNTHRVMDLLLFKKEQKVEVWESVDHQSRQHLFTFALSNSTNLPLGIFDLQIHSKDSSVQIQLPGAYYTQKIKHGMSPPLAWHLSLTSKMLSLSEFIKEEAIQHLEEKRERSSIGKALIFPNDLRKAERFDACLACPHWIVEVYGKLELALQYYSLKPSEQ